MSVLISTGVLAAYFFGVALVPLGQDTFFEAVGLFYKSYGLILRLEVSALLMSASSIIVAVKDVSLRRLKL